jgi:formylglycine-generating enzyme required for sulfatase activity
MANMSLIDFVKYAYAVVIACTLIVEICHRGKIGKVAALASIAFVTSGGAAWSYAAMYHHSDWPTFIAYPHIAKSIGSQSQQARVASAADDDESEDDTGGDGASGSGGAAPAHRVAKAASAGGQKLNENDASRSARVAQKHRTKSADDIELISDCEDCPPLISVPAGTAMIGASDQDAEAVAAEMPTRVQRFWPGFMISAEPVTAVSFRRFQNDTNRKPARCGPLTTDLASGAGTTTDASVGEMFATCTTPGDADAYVSWLTARTGKHFRLPTAAEWEYAANVLPAPGLGTGNVAEIVADCWHERVPEQGTERIAAHTASIDCGGRMLKGAGPLEPARFHRFSARRHIGARQTGTVIGFRVMRSLDGVR